MDERVGEGNWKKLLVCLGGKGCTTLNQQVSSTFDVRRATEVRVEPDGERSPAGWLERPALARLSGLNGVVAAGRRVLLGERTLHRPPGPSASRPCRPCNGEPAGPAPVAHERILVRVVISRRWSAFLILVGVWTWLIWPRFGLAIWQDDRSFAGGTPTSFLWVHALLIGTSLVIGTTVGVLGVRGWRAAARPAEETVPAGPIAPKD